MAGICKATQRRLVSRTVHQCASTAPPQHKLTMVISRHLHSDTLFNEINSSFAKRNSNASNVSNPSSKRKPVPPPPSPKQASKKSKKPSSSNSRSSGSSKQLVRSVSLIDTPKTFSHSLKQRDEQLLSRIDSNTLPSRSMFDKYEMMAAELQQQNKAHENSLTLGESPRQKKDNIDTYIRKRRELKHKEKHERYRDPMEAELDYYEMPISELVTQENILKDASAIATERGDTSTCASALQEDDIALIQSELNMAEIASDFDDEDDLLSDVKIAPNGYDDVCNDMLMEQGTSSPMPGRGMTESQVMKQMDWTKLANYVELNGWNRFAQFLNESEHENAVQNYSIPGFLAHSPQRRKNMDRPKATILGNEEEAFKIYKISQKVQFEPFKRLPNGNVAVLVNNEHYGFVKQENLPIEVKIGEFHSGFLYDVNFFGKLELVMEKPNFWSRMVECQRRIIAVLRYCNGVIEISDKSDPALIRQMFQMSKKNFKCAIGMLLKNRVIELFNERDKNVPNRIILKNLKIDEEHYDPGKKTEEEMWKSKPIWEYGLNAPAFHEILPDELKHRYKRYEQRDARRSKLRRKRM